MKVPVSGIVTLSNGTVTVFPSYNGHYSLSVNESGHSYSFVAQVAAEQLS